MGIQRRVSPSWWALLALAPTRARPAVLLLAVGVLAAGLADRSRAGLAGLTPRDVVAEVTLVGDPAPSFGGLRVDVRWGGHRLEARAQGVAADALRARLAGERVTVSWLPSHTFGLERPEGASAAQNADEPAVAV